MYELAVAGLTILFALGQDWLEPEEGRGTVHGRIRVQPSATKNLFQLQAAVDTYSGLDFEIRQESALDRWGKSLGLVREQQLGRSAFDRNCFLVSDEPAVRNALAGSPALLQQLTHLAESWLGGFNFHRLACRNGELRIELGRSGEQPPVQVMDAVQDQCERRLLALAQALPATGGRAARADWARRRTRWVRAFVYAVFAAGVLAWVYEGLSPTSQGDSHVLRAILKPAAVLLGLMLASTLVLLWRTSRVHTVLFEALIVGGFGALLACWMGARVVNERFDFAPYSERTMTVREHWETLTGNRRRVTHYHLRLDAAGDFPLEMEVSALESWRYENGERVRVRQHSGYLGDPWAEITGRAKK